MPKDTLKVLLRWILGLFYIGVGVHHFVEPELFVAIMPPYLPLHLELVYISGVFEILGGVALLLPVSRRLAGWGLLALLVAVFPANIHMLVNDVYFGDMPRERYLLWLRMPLQLVLALGTAWVAGIWPRSTVSTESLSS